MASEYTAILSEPDWYTALIYLITTVKKEGKVQDIPFLRSLQLGV